MNSNTRFIVHIADIHIGNGQRSAEYRQVFDNLHAIINTLPQDLIIVIAGDIFHHKTRYSGTDIDDFNYLLSALSKYQIIIIPGNHDANLNNKDEVDLLTPVVHPNIHYIKHSGFFTLNNIQFYHISIFDDSTSTQLEHLTSDEKFKNTILLYHGMINGAKFGTHVEYESRITKKVLDNFMITIAGDIHQYQAIGTAVYSGSLIQQNLGESNEKGFVLWNLEEKSHQFIRVLNNKGFIKLDLRCKSPDECKTIITAAKSTAPSELLKVSLVTDASEEHLNEQLNIIKEQFGRIDRVNHMEKRTDINLTDDLTTALNDILTRNGASEEQRTDIINAYKNKIAIYECKKWCITNLSWKNMFKYGTNNCIDFTKLYSNITGVIADNRAGKSSIIDILVFGLFGGLLRGDKKTMIRNGAKDSYIRVDFTVNDIPYYIERTDDRRDHTTVHLYRKDNDTYTNISAVSVDETYKIVRTLIGSLKQFLSTGLYYDSSEDIIKMGKADRMRILPELFGMTDNATIIEELKDNKKSLKAKINALIKPRTSDPALDHSDAMIELDQLRTKRHDIESSLVDINAIIDTIKTQISKLRQHNIIRSEYDQTKIKLNNLYEQINKIIITTDVPFAEPISLSKQEIVRLNELVTIATEPSHDIQTKITTLNATLPSGTINIKHLQMRKDEIQSELTSLRQKLSSIPPTIYIDIDELLNKRDLVDKKLQELKLAPTNDKLIDDLISRIDKLRKKSSLKFNDSCEQCNNNIKYLNSELSDLESELTITRRDNDTIHSNNKKITDSINKLQSLRDKINAKIRDATIGNKNKNTIDMIQSTIIKLEHELADIDKLLIQNIKYQDTINELSRLNESLEVAKNIEDAKDKLQKSYLYEQYALKITKDKLSLDIDNHNNKLQSLSDELSLTESHKQTYADLNKLYEQKTASMSELSCIDKSIGALENNIKRLIIEMEIFDKYNTEHPQLTSELTKLELYIKSIGSVDLKMAVIKKNIDRVLTSANSILSSITDFKLRCNVDKSYIELLIVEPNEIEIPMSLGSGFQKFISSLAMRFALTTSIPASSEFMIIDEGFGCMDAKNTSRLAEMMISIKDLYKFTFIISHINELQNVIEKPLHILQREDKNTQSLYSYISNINVENIIQQPDVADINNADQPNNVVDTVDDKVECKCGRKVKAKSLSKHMQSALHKKWMDKVK